MSIILCLLQYCPFSLRGSYWQVLKDSMSTISYKKSSEIKCKRWKNQSMRQEWSMLHYKQLAVSTVSRYQIHLDLITIIKIQAKMAFASLIVHIRSICLNFALFAVPFRNPYGSKSGSIPLLSIPNVVIPLRFDSFYSFIPPSSILTLHYLVLLFFYMKVLH